MSLRGLAAQSKTFVRTRILSHNGIARTFNPKKWEHGTCVLVFGEFIAFIAALVSIWLSNGHWLLAVAAAIGAGSLFFYALDKTTLGEMPLTGTSARRIRAVVHLMESEKMLGEGSYDWDSIRGDGAGIQIGYPENIRTDVLEKLKEIDRIERMEDNS